LSEHDNDLGFVGNQAETILEFIKHNPGLAPEVEALAMIVSAKDFLAETLDQLQSE